MSVGDEDRIPLHKPVIGDEEIEAVTRVMRSGWLTTGAECKQFEEEFARFIADGGAVGAPTGRAFHAIAVNSCTAALHLALEATGLARGDRAIVPALTFAATAEVVRYFDAVPVIVDIEPGSMNIDVDSAQAAIDDLATGRDGLAAAAGGGPVHAILPVHYGGQMVDVDAVAALARKNGLRVIEDSAHALPAAAQDGEGRPRTVGATAEITCFSFYANKTITTGEGGLLLTADEKIAERARRMSLHGLSRDAWKRYAGGSWYYEILDAGFKYNMTDVAAATGRVQLRRAARLREQRAAIASRYAALLGDVAEVELPVEAPDRVHSWHLFPLRLVLGRLSIDRDEFIAELGRAGIGASVHYMPLHLHPYYRDRFGYLPEHCPVATAEWKRLVSLPIYPSMTEREIERVAAAVRAIAGRFARARAA